MSWPRVTRNRVGCEPRALRRVRGSLYELENRSGRVKVAYEAWSGARHALRALRDPDRASREALQLVDPRHSERLARRSRDVAWHALSDALLPWELARQRFENAEVPRLGKELRDLLWAEPAFRNTRVMELALPRDVPLAVVPKRLRDELRLEYGQYRLRLTKRLQVLHYLRYGHFVPLWPDLTAARTVLGRVVRDADNRLALVRACARTLSDEAGTMSNAEGDAADSVRLSEAGGPARAASPAIPSWDGNSRVLSYQKKEIYRLTRAAPNIEALLDAFQACNWKKPVFEAFARSRMRVTKEGARSAVHWLNKRQNVLKFSGGLSSGVRWQRKAD